MRCVYCMWLKGGAVSKEIKASWTSAQRSQERRERRKRAKAAMKAQAESIVQGEKQQ